MSILSAINEAKAAASHAKPFMRLMDSLSNLEGELRAANQVQTDADAAEAKKTSLQAEIEKLEASKKSLNSYVEGIKAEALRQKAESDEAMASREKTAAAELDASLTAIKEDHEKTISAHKATIAALKIELNALKEQKAEAQKQIDDLKASFQKAHAAIGA